MSVLLGLGLSVAVLLVATMVPVATAAGEPDLDPGPTPATTDPPASAGPITTPPPSPSPSPSPPTAPSRIAVEPLVPTLSQYRYLGAWVVGIDVPDGPVQIDLDGRQVTTVQVDGRGFEELVRFEDAEVGQHEVSIRAGDRILADTTVEVEPDRLDLDVSPRWITAQTLRASGVRLSTTTAPAGSTVLAQRIVPDEQEPSVLAQGVADADGRVALTVDAASGLTVAPGTVHVLGLSVDDDLRFAYDRVRITRLTATEQPDGTVRGTGFEPGRPVTMLVGGTVVAERTADEDTSVSFTAPVVGRQVVTLRSSAGEVTLSAGVDIDLTALTDRIERDGLAAREAARNAAQLQMLAAQERLREQALVAGSDGLIQAIVMTVKQSLALTQQIAAQQQIIGPFPPAPQKSSGKDRKVEAGEKLLLETDQQRKQRELDVKSAKQSAQERALALEQQIGALDPATLQRLQELHEGTMDYLRQIEAALAVPMSGGTARPQAVVRASQPEIVALTRAADESIEVLVPADFRGTHHVGMFDVTSGVVTMWQEFEVAGPSPQGTVNPVTGGRALPAAGADLRAELVPLGLILLLAGGCAIAHGRRRVA